MAERALNLARERGGGEGKGAGTSTEGMIWTVTVVMGFTRFLAACRLGF